MKPIAEYGWDNVFDVLAWISMSGCIVYIFVLFGNVPPASTTEAISSSSGAASGIVRRIKERTPDTIVQPKEVEDALKKADEISKAHDHSNIIRMMKALIEKYPRQPYPYVYLARAQDAKKQIWQAISNYTKGIKLNPNFVDKFSTQRIGPELKVIVKQALIIQRSGKMPPEKKKYVKNLYYLQRRLSGGCE